MLNIGSDFTIMINTFGRNSIKGTQDVAKKIGNTILQSKLLTLFGCGLTVKISTFGRNSINMIKRTQLGILILQTLVGI